MNANGGERFLERRFDALFIICTYDAMFSKRDEIGIDLLRIDWLMHYDSFVPMLGKEEWVGVPRFSHSGLNE